MYFICEGLICDLWLGFPIPWERTNLKYIPLSYQYTFPCQISCPHFSIEDKDLRVWLRVCSQGGLRFNVPLNASPGCLSHPTLLPPCSQWKQQEEIKDPTRGSSGSLGNWMRKEVKKWGGRLGKACRDYKLPYKINGGGRLLNGKNPVSPWEVNFEPPFLWWM